MSPIDPKQLAKLERQTRLEDRSLITTLLAAGAAAVIAVILQLGGRPEGVLFGALLVALGIALIAAIVWGISAIRSGQRLDRIDPAGRAPRRPLWAYILPFGAGLLVGGLYWFVPDWRQWTWKAFVIGGFGFLAWISIRSRRRTPRRSSRLHRNIHPTSQPPT
jgi:hypothetical protein